jgi:hypothetical protein
MHFIDRDFDVTLIAEEKKASIRYGTRSFHHHFVFLSESNFLDQIYISRFLLAKFYLKEDKEAMFKLYNNDHILILENKINYTRHGNKYEIKDSVLNQQIAKDVKKLVSIQNKLQKNKDYFNIEVNQFIKSLNIDAQINIELSELEKEWLLFELSLNTKSKQKDKQYGIFNIFIDYISFERVPDNFMLDLFSDTLQNILYQEVCTCSSYCFFEELKKNQIAFFGTDIDKIKINEANLLLSLWEDLNKRQRTALYFISDCFENTPLLNLSFLRKDFDINIFIELMTEPYQPDDEDQSFLRTNIINVYDFLMLDNTSQLVH